MRTPIQHIGGLLTVLVFALCSCTQKKQKEVLFEALGENRTGIRFANNLRPTKDFNMFHYMYYYNGAGVGAGDFNNDGLIDLFFASNEADNKLFLNKGKLQFADVTEQAKVPQDSGWNTGVSVVDINNDGLLDIYICRLGKFEKFRSKNQLLVCKGITNGIPAYEDKAEAYGLDFSGFSTQAAFFDYDQDGDLDMFLLNHSVHQNGTFAPRREFLGTYHPLSGDRLYRNDGSRFTDVTKESKINSSAISYGLGVAVSDINLDGWPDLYAGNDFHENDYLYINQKNGSFADESHESFMHTSQYSMGVDIGDANNDGYPEIVSMDMLPDDPYILKRSLGEDDYDIAKYKISVGYDHQFTRNNLQWNRRNGNFSETGMYSGIYATDWSWATLWVDFDNDGLKDLFVANGIPKRMNDMDYVNFVSNSEIQNKIRDNQMGSQDLALIDKFPEIKIPNKFYRNKGGLSFDDYESGVQNNLPTYSNGAIYADLDNDGDLDLVVNNINDPALVYENKTNLKKDNRYAEIRLNGPAGNRNAVGARIVMFTAGKGVRLYEKYPVRGFLSSMEIPLFIGLQQTKADSAFLVWPDNTCERIDLNAAVNKTMQFAYRKGLPRFDYTSITNRQQHSTTALEDISVSAGIQFRHQENVFQEFNREPLIPHMTSTEGPALAVADINNDGMEDVFIGAARSFTGAVYLQGNNGRFERTIQPALSIDSNYEDTDAQWIDVNADGYKDLVVASGGNEYYGKDIHMMPRLYLNNGKGQLSKSGNAIPVYVNASSIVAADFNKDGFPDLFVAGRVTPFQYGAPAPSYLLLNNGKGIFKDVTAAAAPELVLPGMITYAISIDIDNNNWKDLVVCYEWGGIDAYINRDGKFSRKTITERSGWWNFVLPVDFDKDGDMDFVAGNAGLNTRLQATEKEPVRLYNNDFDDNGKAEQVMTYYLKGKEIPFPNKDELQKQIPMLRKKFLYAEDFAKASLADIFSKEKLNASRVSKADYFANALIINNGNSRFTVEALPWQAQLSCYKTAAICDANNDNRPDILLMGNFFDNNIQMGRYDADYGTLLVNKGGGRMEAEPLHQLSLKGQVRRISPIVVNKRNAFVLAMNNDSLRVISFKK